MQDTTPTRDWQVNNIIIKGAGLLAPFKFKIKKYSNNSYTQVYLFIY